MSPGNQSGKANVIRCRHTLDELALKGLTELLSDLPVRAPKLLRELHLPPRDFFLYFNAAIQSIRGTSAATTSAKRQFLEEILNLMRDDRFIRTWDFVGTKGRQDYKVLLTNRRTVCIEAKGCPDGNNLNIWDRPAWAEEFIVWSQCPDSLANQPGEGVWSGIATRLLTKIAVDRQQVDAFIFYDGRCASSERRCWKKYGIDGRRAKATEIAGQDKRDWLPPPCIYLFPRTVPNPRTNPRPPLHSLKSCQFADALLGAFRVPKDARQQYTHWASIELKQDEHGIHKRIQVGHELGSESVVVSDWTKLKRE